MPIARGQFEVATKPEPPFLEQDGNRLSRNTIRKQFSGDMTGSSEAQMLAAHTDTPGSAGYVAIEHFSGSIEGRSGSFILQHSGVMASGGARLTVEIIPDSGTDDLSGISGTMEIDNDDGEHSYTLDYKLSH